jgi:hypothetical protein
MPTPHHTTTTSNRYLTQQQLMTHQGAITPHNTSNNITIELQNKTKLCD